MHPDIEGRLEQSHNVQRVRETLGVHQHRSRFLRYVMSCSFWGSFLYTGYEGPSPFWHLTGIEPATCSLSNCCANH